MSLERWEPFTELRRIHDEMDRMFEGLMRPSMFMPTMTEELAPPIDIFDRDNSVVVRADVPGLNREDIEVIATDDSICLRGEFKREEKIEEEGFYRRERHAGRFYRTIPMPVAIKPGDVKASFRDGILEITAPKAEEAKAKEKKVPIEV
jgi:HSP20 family protein